MPMYQVPRCDTTPELGKETNTHCEHPLGPTSSKPHGSMMDRRGTAHEDREAHIFKEMCASILSFPMARPDSISTQDWQCPLGSLF